MNLISKKLLTDWYTSDLFSLAVHASGVAIEFPISRIVVDPERFQIDSQEPMSEVGMGVLYTRTTHGDLMRAKVFTQVNIENVRHLLQSTS